MEVNGSTLIGLQESFQALFLDRYAGVTPQWPTFAMLSPSMHAREEYQWLGALPLVKEWFDEKSIDRLRGFGYTIKNRDWESTLGVDRNDIEDDMLGVYRPAIVSMSEEAAYHQDSLLTEIRTLGATELCYDGQFFYDTDHVSGSSGAQSNLLTGTGVTIDKVQTDFRVARAAMRKYKDDRGKPFVKNRMARLQFMVTIPPDLEGVFEELKNATTISNTTNVLKDAFDYRVDNELADTNDWYLDYVGSSIKAFIMQMRKRPMFVSKEDPNTSDHVFTKKEFLYGTEARYNAGYGLWQFSIKTTNT